MGDGVKFAEGGGRDGDDAFEYMLEVLGGGARDC